MKNMKDKSKKIDLKKEFCKLLRVETREKSHWVE